MLIKYAFTLSLFFILVFKMINSSWDGFNQILSLKDQRFLLEDNFYNDLIVWSKTSPFELFVVPPDSALFFKFRFFSKKSIWGTVHDINQLAYSPDYYLRAFNRLKVLGLETHGLHKYNFAYNSCFLSSQERLIDKPIVFEETHLNGCLDRYQELYRNQKYVVLRKK